MRTARRVAVIGLIVTVVAVGLGFLAWPYLLGSAYGRSVAASKLSAALGMPVTVGKLETASGSTTVGLTLGDLATIEALTANVSVRDLIAGRQPTTLTARGVTLTLRLSADGKVLSQLPTGGDGNGGTIPAVHLSEATVKVKQDGQPEFVLTNVVAEFDPAAGTLTGSVTDPGWGNWTVAGTIDTTAGTFRIELATPGAIADLQRLKSIPYIPVEVWDHVRPAGPTAAKVTLALPADRKFAYAVDLTPTAGRIELPDLDATLTDATGTVRIAGSAVTLTGCKARLADGGVRVDGVLDFGPEPSVLKLKVHADGWDVKKLPGEWEVPTQFGGKLRGAADLDIRIFAGGRMEPRATGGGVVEGANLNGLPLEVKLTLRGDGKRLKFGNAATGTPRKSSRPLQPPVAPPAEPTTLDAEVTLRDVDLAELLTKLEVAVPYKLGGKVTVTATVSIPIGTPEQRRTYRFRGKFSAPTLTLEGLSLANVAADLRYADGKLTLRSLTADVPGGGKVTGTASVGVEPRGDLTADLTLAAVDLQAALKGVPRFTADVRGPVDGTATFRGPVEKLADATTWTGAANLTAKQLTVFARTVVNAKVVAKLAAGTLTLTDAAGTFEGVPVTGTGTLGLTAPYRYAATATATQAVADLRKLAPELSLPFPAEGTITADAKANGTLSPATVSITGSAVADKLTLAGTPNNSLSLKWALTDERVKLTDLTGTLFAGTVAGAADIPFDRSKSAAFDIQFTDIDAGAATKGVRDFPVRLAGRASGKLVGTIPAAVADKPRPANLNLELSSPKLSVQGIPTEKLTGKLTAVAGKVTYNLDGKTLGGSFELKGTYPGQERGSLKASNLDLHRLALDGRFGNLGPLAGRVDLTADFAGDLSEGTGRVLVRGLRWGSAVLSPELLGSVKLADGVVELVDVNGPLAGGTVRGRGRVYLATPVRNFVSLTVEQADPKILFAPVPEVANVIDGRVSITARGRFGTETTITGTASLPRGSIFGLGVTEVRLPFDVAAARGSGEITVRDAAGGGGGGRLAGQVQYRWGLEDRLAGDVRFTDARLNAIVTDLGSVGGLGQGRITGRFVFGGSNLRSADDLTGTLTAKLNEASVREIPILRLLTPYLSPIGLTTPFQAGEVEARLGRGVFRVHHLTLGGAAVQLFAEGTVNLNGRLDLDVVGRTGQVGPSLPALRLFGLRLPAFGPIPITLIADVSEFLSNRTLRLHVTGTVSSPQVQVNRAALLTEEAVRYFLGVTPLVEQSRPNR